MKRLFFILPSLLILILSYSCTNDGNSHEGTYVREVPTEKNDSIIVTHLKENIFYVEASEWNNGKRESKRTTVTIKNDVIHFENSNTVKITDKNEILVGNTKYVKID